MKRILHPGRLLTALVLLLTGALQPLAAAQDLACMRDDVRAAAIQGVTAAIGVAVTASGSGETEASSDHLHGHEQQGQDAVGACAPCVAILPPSDQGTPLAAPGRELLTSGDQPVPHPLRDSLFRPPRLS